MNHELEVKLQAHVDGELSASEAREVEALLAGDAGAKALSQELSWMRAAMKGNELDRPVTDTREFYWSQIQRAIASGEKQAAREEKPVLAGWRKFLAPLTAFGVIALLAVSMKLNAPPQDTWLAEVENMAEETHSVSFRAKSQNMFVVWVYDKSTESAAANETLLDDSLYQ